MSGNGSSRSLLIWTGFAFVAAIATTPFDAALSDWVSGSLAPDGTWLRQILKWIQHLRGGVAITLYALALAHVSYTVGRAWKPLVGAGVATLAATALMHACKFAVGRARPELDLGPRTFRPLSTELSYDSFPSAHAGSAMLIALLFVNLIPLRGPWRWLYLPLALFVIGAGLTRIAQRRHYPSDVLAGIGFAAAGLWIAKIALKSEYLAPLTRGDSIAPSTTT